MAVAIRKTPENIMTTAAPLPTDVSSNLPVKSAKRPPKLYATTYPIWERKPINPHILPCNYSKQKT